jgi:predicted small secreted protein
MKKLLAGLVIAAGIFAFAACQQPTSDDSSDSWDVLYSYAPDRVAGQTVFNAETEDAATEKYEFAGGTFKKSEKVGGAWIVKESGTYTTNGFTRTVYLWTTRIRAADYTTPPLLYNQYYVDAATAQKLMGIIANVDSDGLADDVAVMNVSFDYFTANPDQFLKSMIGRNYVTTEEQVAGISEAEINTMWALVGQGYGTDKAAYIRDMRIHYFSEGDDVDYFFGANGQVRFN